MSSNSTADGRFSIARQLRTRHQSRHCPGAGAEPRRHRAAAAAGRRPQHRRHGDKKLARPDDGRAPLFARQVARRAVHVQLRDAGSDRCRSPASTASARSRCSAAATMPCAVWLDPDRLQSLGLTATDVTSALQGQNIQVASGVLDQPPAAHQGAFQIAVQTLGRLANPEEFGSIVVKQTPGAVVRLKRCRQDRAGRARLFVELLPRSRSGSRARHFPASGLECARRPRKASAS